MYPKFIYNRTLLYIFGLSSYLSLNTVQGKGNTPPNIIFIFADDMGYGDISALNEDSKITTPHLDRLAHEGVIFTDAHSSSSVSTPSRYSLLTGRYNWRSELKSNVLYGYDEALIPDNRRTIADVLGECGYHTACIGKWHLGWHWSGIEKGEEQIDFSQPISNGPTTRGFDYFYGIAGSLDMPPYVYVENDRPTAVPDHTTVNTGLKFWRKGPTAPDFNHEQTLPHLINQAVDYIQKRVQTNTPFFLYLPLPAPHTPILPIKEYQGKSGLSPYGDFVIMVDDMVGQIMETLKKEGIDENTILVFSTDNGCSPAADTKELENKGHFASYIYRGYKSDLYEGGHRVPCLVRWPQHIKPHSINQTICLTDFFATFSALANYSIPDNEGEDSYNLLPLLLKNKEKKIIREATVHHSIDGEFTIRKGPWKLLLSPGSGGWSSPRRQEITEDMPRIQLYHLDNDPKEQHNLYNDYPDVVKEMRALLIKYIQEGRSTPGIPQKNDGPQTWKQIEWITTSLNQ